MARGKFKLMARKCRCCGALSEAGTRRIKSVSVMNVEGPGMNQKKKLCRGYMKSD